MKNFWIKIGLILSSSIGAASCASSINVLTINDFTIYFGNNPKQIPYSFSNNKYEEISYEYDSTLFNISENKIVALWPEGTYPIKAITKHNETTFNVTIESIEPIFQPSVSYFQNDAEIREVQEGSTIFFGDSFFDVRDPFLWHDFYDEVGGNAYNCGIGASTMKGWMAYLERLVYIHKPSNVVIHLGNNDFYNDGMMDDDVYGRYINLVKDVHENLPECQIYFFAVEPRTSYVIKNHTLDETIEAIQKYNNKAMEFAKNTSYLKFINSYYHFTKENGQADSIMLQDGTHPYHSEYGYYLNELKKAGLNLDIIDTNEIHFDSTSLYLTTLIPVFKNKNWLNKDYEIEFKLNINNDRSSFFIQIDTTANSFEIVMEDSLINIVTKENSIRRKCIINYSKDNFKIKIKNSNGSATLYIENEDIDTINNLPGKSCLSLASDKMDCSVQIIK